MRNRDLVSKNRVVFFCLAVTTTNANTCAVIDNDNNNDEGMIESTPLVGGRRSESARHRGLKCTSERSSIFVCITAVI